MVGEYFPQIKVKVRGVVLTMLCVQMIRIFKSTKPELVGYGYQRFHYEDDRYARIASNPTDNRKVSRRVRYDRPLGDGAPDSYGLLRPRMLMQTNGDSKPTLVRDYPV
jgi:hypothetical protein